MTKRLARGEFNLNSREAIGHLIDRGGLFGWHRCTPLVGGENLSFHSEGEQRIFSSCQNDAINVEAATRPRDEVADVLNKRDASLPRPDTGGVYLIIIIELTR